ncbi:unnamed protein product [Effrenium voratum]|nr:unnamed protein product [Effrenium voratum]
MRLDGCTQTEPIFREFGCAIFWPYWTSAALCMKLGHVARSEHLLQGTNVCTQTEPICLWKFWPLLAVGARWAVGASATRYEKCSGADVEHAAKLVQVQPYHSRLKLGNRAHIMRRPTSGWHKVNGCV